MPLAADADAVYDEVIEIDLSALEPLAACPHSPDNVEARAQPCHDEGGPGVHRQLHQLQLCGSDDRGRDPEGQNGMLPNVSLAIAPGSRQVLAMLSANGALTALLDAGARILECACGPCIGMGQSPNSAGVSLRTFNRNFEGRSGTRDAGVIPCKP